MPEVEVEDCIDEGIENRITPSQPREHLKSYVRHVTTLTRPDDDVNNEKRKPTANEDADDHREYGSCASFPRH